MKCARDPEGQGGAEVALSLCVCVCVCVFSLTLGPYFLAGLNYVLTADVAKKEKSQLPRVYLVLLGESVGQVSEKLQLVHMEETCHHYVAHVKVSPPFSPYTLISTDVHLELWKPLLLWMTSALTSQIFVHKEDIPFFFFFDRWSLTALYLSYGAGLSLRGGSGGRGDLALTCSFGRFLFLSPR